MPTLDSILNWVIPPAIFIIFLWLFIKPLQGQIGSAYHWIRDLIRGKEEEKLPYNQIVYYE